MPVKFSQSSKKFEKGSRTNYTWEHDYIKHKTKEQLIEYINTGSKPKLKRKCRIELDRRGVKLVWKTPVAENS